MKPSVPRSRTTNWGKQTPGTGDQRDRSPPHPEFSLGTFWEGWLDARPCQHTLNPPHARHCEAVTGA